MTNVAALIITFFYQMPALKEGLSGFLEYSQKNRGEETGVQAHI